MLSTAGSVGILGRKAGEDVNVTETQIVEAMRAWETRHISLHGRLDGISMPKECSTLADLLGVMWFCKETQAQISENSEVALLIKEAPSQ